MIMKRKVLLLIVLPIYISIAKTFAADKFLETSLKFAHARDKKLAVAREQINLANTRVVRSMRSFLPSLALERKFSRGRTIKEEVGEGYQSEELGIRAYQPLYEGGRLKNTYAYDTMMLKSAKYNYTKVREELYYNVKATYYEYLTLKMEHSRLKKSFADIDKMAKRVRKEYKAKAISELELIEALHFRDKVEDMFKAAELNLSLVIRKFCALVNIDELNDIPEVLPEGLPEDVPEISYVLDECINFLLVNNIDIKINKLHIKMADKKCKIVKSKVIPKLYADGFYGRSGETNVTVPMELATVWNIMGKISWGFWGNSLELNHQQEKALAADVIDVGTRIDSSGYGMKFALFDDMNYFVESKESKVGLRQAKATYDDTVKKLIVELEKAFNEYRNSLRNAMTSKNEVALRKRKLKLLKKRNQLYEVSTLNVMEETLKYAEAISSYTRALATNYSNVASMERLTLTPLR